MRYWTSDLHIGHTNIIKFCDRPFVDTNHQTEILIQNWNNVVNPDDEVWMLGDIVMGHFIQEMPHIARLNGTKYLVAGNHDRVWRGNKPAYAEGWQQSYDEVGMITISHGEPVLAQIGSHRVNVSHFPYESDSRHDDKYNDHLPADDGLWVIHGHVHTAWKVRGRQINVGVDMWDYTPVSDAQLLKIMEATQ